MTPDDENRQGESNLDHIERILYMVTHDIVQLQAGQEEHDKRHAELEESINRFVRENREAHREFQQECQLLLKAQVVLTDKLDRLSDRVDKLVEAQQNTEERLNALISVVDGIVRRPPP